MGFTEEAGHVLAVLGHAHLQHKVRVAAEPQQGALLSSQLHQLLQDPGVRLQRESETQLYLKIFIHRDPEREVTKQGGSCPELFIFKNGERKKANNNNLKNKGALYTHGQTCQF